MVFCKSAEILTNFDLGVVAEDEKNHECSNMSYGPCVFKNGATCGVGKKLATPVDENCPKIQKQVHCKVPCEPQPTGECVLDIY